MPFDFKGPFVNPQNQQGGQPPAPGGGAPAPSQPSAPAGGGSNAFTPSPEQQERLAFLQQQADNSPQNRARQLQGAVQEAEMRLRQAQMNGAPPNVMMQLQYALQNAQMELQQAGAAFAHNAALERNRMANTGGGQMGKRGSVDPGAERYRGQQAGMANADINNAYIMSLFGMGGGMGGMGGGGANL